MAMAKLKGGRVEFSSDPLVMKEMIKTLFKG